MSSVSILSWKDANSWKHAVRELLNDAITDGVVGHFLRNPPEFVVSDDLSWLDDIIFDVTKKHVDSRFLLSERLVGHFSMIRAYHACCPTDLNSYRQHGLMLLNIEDAHDFAREFFCETVGVALGDVEAAIRSQDASLREKRIWLGIDDRMLTQYCGHYLLYGSEYIVAIAAELTRSSKDGTDYRRFLKRRGTPTVIACNVPFSAISASTIGELAGTMLGAMFEDLLQPNRPNSPLDFGFELETPLPSDNIVDFIHPCDIRDPFNLD